ncbi:MAG: TonB-dependent receptor [Mangrovibacterium sp.]|nr:TonB-dependent receptor [Mangrovibacterium sp.]
MKLTFTLLLFWIAGAGASTYSQTTRFNLSFNGNNLIELFKQIEENSEFCFFYQKEDLSGLGRISIDARDATVTKILDEALKGSSLEYKIVDRYIIVRKAGSNYGNTRAELQQPGSVSGKVTDSDGFPLPGVSVVIKGTNQGTTTGADGSYFLLNVPANSVLVFSFVGMKKLEIPVDGRPTLNTAMEEETVGIDEVVAIGYGTQKKVNVIGSVSAVSGKDLTVAPVSSVSNMLAGRLPGAVFMQGSGNPGANTPTIRIRGNATLGNNTPLIVIDGITDRDINSLHPDDIESISVLKDASAAIYGARAANGVILVTTKRGAAGKSPTLSYRYSHGFQSPTKLPEMADAATYAQMIREYQSYKGTPEASMKYSSEDVEKYRYGEYPWTHPNTDWFAEVFKDYSTSRSHSVSVTGGSPNVNYYVSYGSQFDDGLYRENATKYNRHNLKANVDIKINEFLSFRLDVTGIQENRMYPSYSGGSLVRDSHEWRIFDITTRMWPTSPARWPNGLPGPDFERGIQPVVLSSDKTGFEKDKRYFSNNVFSATLKIPGVKGLSMTGQYAYDVFYRRNKFFHKPWYLYYLDKDAYLAAGNTGKEDGSDFLIESQVGVAEPFLIEDSGESHSKTGNIRLDYSNTFNEVHRVEAFVAYEQNEYDSESFDAGRRFFLSDQLPYLFAGGDEQKTNSASVGLDSRMNYFGRVSYAYKDTYLFQFSLRRDGSLRFSKESGRWGTFPSVLVGWKMSNEEWWQRNLGVIDFFKLKASWGQMGNDRVNAFQYLTMYEFSTGLPLGEDKIYEAGLTQTGTPNPNITWEVANIVNVGWESSFFKKFMFNSDFFYERRNHILVKRNASVPQFVGITLPDENYGIVDSYGVEVMMGFKDHKGEFSYGIDGNFNFARNKVIEFDEPENPVPWQVRTGKPQDALLLYKWTGIFRDEEHLASYPHVEGAQPGDLVLEDYNDDKKIDGSDRQLLPFTDTPEITFGINAHVKYRNWELSALIQGHGRGLKRLDDDIQRGLAGNYFRRDAIDRWTPDHTDASRPRAFNWQDEYWRSDDFASTYFYDKISFARLKNLQLSYSLPQRILNSVNVKAMKVYFSGQNLWLLWSAQHFADPEINSVSHYPLMKIFSFGAQISF